MSLLKSVKVCGLTLSSCHLLALASVSRRAKELEKAGCSAITVHGRTRVCFRLGPDFDHLPVSTFQKNQKMEPVCPDRGGVCVSCAKEGN